MTEGTHYKAATGATSGALSQHQTVAMEVLLKTIGMGTPWRASSSF